MLFFRQFAIFAYTLWALLAHGALFIKGPQSLVPPPQNSFLQAWARAQRAPPPLLGAPLFMRPASCSDVVSVLIWKKLLLLHDSRCWFDVSWNFGCCPRRDPLDDFPCNKLLGQYLMTAASCSGSISQAILVKYFFKNVHGRRKRGPGAGLVYHDNCGGNFPAVEQITSPVTGFAPAVKT